jgi:hypothetical protein
MPRLPGLDAPRVLCHVMDRGIERIKIFLRDIDRNDFIDRLSTLAKDEATEIYACILASIRSAIQVQFHDNNIRIVPLDFQSMPFRTGNIGIYL